MRILLYIFGAFIFAAGALYIIFELLSISIFADRELSLLYRLFPGLTDWVSVPLVLIVGSFMIAGGRLMMNKAWGDDSNDK